MSKLWATILAELLVLWRDRAGLLLLFAMPAALVVVITLIQENVFRLMAESEIPVMLLDEDQGEVGLALRELLDDSGAIDLVDRWEAAELDRESMIGAIRDGSVRVGIIIPRDTSSAVRERSRQLALQAFAPNDPAQAESARPVPELSILLDPAAEPSLRGRVRGALERAALMIEMKERAGAFLDLLSESPLGSNPSFRDSDDRWAEARVLPISEQPAFTQRMLAMPSAAQHNVPAWGLFGMFFIAVPMATSLVNAREHGILQRLLTMPVSPISLLGGRAMAYALVSLLELAFITAIGIWLMPRLGVERLELGSAPLALVVVALCSAMAATAFGLLLGAAARTLQQVTTFGPLSIVVGAAVGGIMVPISAMPAPLQKLSKLCPLAWAHEAFVEILVRDGSIASVATEVSLLIGFSALMISLGSIILWRRGS